MKPRILVVLGLLVVTLTAPAVAQEEDRAEELTRRTYCLHTISKDLLATGTSFGLVLYRLNERGFPTRAGRLKLDDAITALASEDGLVFAGNGPRGLVVVDVADPDGPVEVARLATPGAILRLLREGDVLYAAMGPMGVGVIDIKDPKKPSFVKRIELAGTTRDLCHGRDGIMAAAETFTWIQEPLSPNPRVTFSGIPAPGAVLHQRYYLVGTGSNVHAVDALGFSAGGGRIFHMDDTVRDMEAFRGGVAVAASSDGLLLLEFNGLSHDEAVRLDPGGACTRVHSRGTLIFATADAYGFAVYDAKDPRKPVKIYPAE